MFRTDWKKFYSILRQKHTYVKKATTKEEIEKLWKEIFGKKVQHNEEASESKANANKIRVPKGAQYRKRSSQTF
jgi:hypothetical protein